jgi:hypothetical protein
MRLAAFFVFLCHCLCDYLKGKKISLESISFIIFAFFYVMPLASPRDFAEGAYWF